jgi:anti-sigma B factor antagonist
MSLKITVEERMSAMFKVHISGVLDTSTYKQFDSQIAPLLVKKTDTIILDMEKLEYISSMGVRSVQKVSKQMKDFNGKMLMINVPLHIKEVFEIIKAMPSEDIFESIEEMDKYLISRQNKVKRKESGFED